MASPTSALFTTAAMAVVVVGALLPATASADTYVVGDDDGWALEVDYNEWASVQTLYVGDILEFQYETGQPNPHNVVLVDEANFKACTVPSNNPFTVTSGDDIVPLYSTGQYYFISSLNGDCQSGMKLNVNVAQQQGSDG